MAPSSTHRGWLLGHNNGILAGVYNGAQPGTSVLATNTALSGILVGTPVTPALAVDSLVISNLVASGDLLLAANNGGNSQAWLWVDASAGTMTLYGAGTAAAILSATAVEVEDGILLALGNDQDQVLVHRSTVLDPNTALTGVLSGTPTVAGIPVNSLIVSNVSVNGDQVFASIFAGPNSIEWMRCDGSAAQIVFNEDSADLNYRFETNGLQFAIYSDGAKDSLVLGSNTDTSSADQLITVSRAARTATANTSYYDLIVAPAGAVTVPAGTTAVVASLALNEPNITATGTVTRAATLYIASQPTEGSTANAAIYFGAAANIAGTTSITINEDSEDVDFRIESNGIQYAIYADGGKDALVLGSNTDTSSADQLITVSRAARTATATVNYYDFIIAPAGAVTVPAGVTALVASARFNEPNITATGTVTAAATVYIADAPTEGGSNYALWIETGVLRLDGNLDLGDAAVDILVKAATAAALEISDGTTKFYAFDTRVATAGVTTHALDISDYTFASASGAVATGLSLAAHTLNYTGNTQVTSAVNTVSLGGRTIAGDTATLTVDQANTLRLAAPIEGTNVAITAASAIRIADAGGTPVNQYGIYIEALTAGATADYAIWVAGASAVHLGTAGTAAGTLEIDGATSGTLTIIAGASTTSHTMTMPPTANTNAGYQLTCAGADTVTSWAGPASLREFKDIKGQHDAQDALDKLLRTRVYDFRYKPGKGTLDAETAYVGVMADEAPWAMHHQGGIVNPVNTLGYGILAIQALHGQIEDLRRQLAALARE